MERPANTRTATAAVEPPITYVQADAHTFRDLVQRLTGAAAGDLPVATAARTSPTTVAPRRQPFKLQEGRGPSVRNLEIQLGLTSLRSPRSPPPHVHHHLIHHHHHASSSSSPAAASSKSPIPSPVTPLGSDPLFSSASEEERAIAEKGFYLHPSPRGSGRGSDPPELLPLFPLRSSSEPAAVEHQTKHDEE
ncbi:VQ motif-containing protein 31-like [Phoenix dactylifera]|uniref:VQ motif-containing protein 31-like n=1 Tax=Phoenix dactylifera TaxID=42345 RepID=A0A8B8J4M3_PHODC|nr:VQ motif-containing protein 31-like [Phoenix dactylifera]